MSDYILSSSSKRRRTDNRADQSSQTPSTTAKNRIVIDLTEDDQDNTSPSLVENFHNQPATDGYHPVMAYAGDEALARALQAEYDSIYGAKTQQTPRAESSKKPVAFDDEEYARRLQAQFDDEDAGFTATTGKTQSHSGNQEEALARMLKKQHVHIDDDEYVKISSPQNSIDKPRSTQAFNSDITRNDHSQTSEFMQTTSEPALQAKEVEATVRQFTELILKLRCARCGKCSLQSENYVIAASQSILDDAGQSGGFACPACNKQDTTKDRATLIWVLLCGFDDKSKANKAEKQRQPARPKMPASKSSLGSGTGYGGHDRQQYGNPLAYQYVEPFDYGSLSGIDGDLARFAPSPEGTTTKQKALNLDDVMTAQVMTSLVALLPSYEKESSFDLDPPTKQLQALLLCSSILERAAELLRNNNLEDITSRTALYHTLARFVQTLASHHATSALVFGDRVIRSPGTGLLKVSLSKEKLVSTNTTDTTQPLTKCLKDLASQCTVMLRSKDSDTKELPLFRAIKELYEFLEMNVNPLPAQGSVKSDISWMKDNAVSEVPDENILSAHCLASKAMRSTTIMPGRMKRIMQEIARLQASLPENIFFRYASSRPDVMKFLIVGPMGTPYENGLFEFDMLCGVDFPTSPPLVQFRTTGGGCVEFNPNLYGTGKVCLSLLGTWQGEPWKPKESTLLQVLVSIQAMIFCEQPWYNEPGREKMPNCEENSSSYNRGLYHHTVQAAMIDWMERRRYAAPSAAEKMDMRYGTTLTSRIDTQPNIWDEVVQRHFSVKQDEILRTITKWLSEGSALYPPKAYAPQGGYYGANPYAAQLPYSGMPYPSAPAQALFGSGYVAPGSPYGVGPGMQPYTSGYYANSPASTAPARPAIASQPSTTSATLLGTTFLQKLHDAVRKLSVYGKNHGNMYSGGF